MNARSSATASRISSRSSSRNSPSRSPGSRHELEQQAAEDLDVVRLVPQRVAEHRPDRRSACPAGRATGSSRTARRTACPPCTGRTRRCSVRAAAACSGTRMSRSRRRSCETRVTNSFLATIDGTSVEHRLALVRVDPERRDHVQQRVGVDVLLVRVAAEHELELGRGDELAHDVDDVVADDPLGGARSSRCPCGRSSGRRRESASARATAPRRAASGRPRAPSGSPSSSGRARTPSRTAAAAG